MSQSLFGGKKAAPQLLGFVVVALTMIEMFTIPKSYFALGSIVSTIAMACSAYLVSSDSALKTKIRFPKIGVGIVTALILYFVFYLGNYGINTLNLPGIKSGNEQGIYGLFSNVPIPLLILILALDAIGFEYYFRGNLQSLFAKKIGIGAVLLVAVIDAIIHISTLNPLFPATVIVADSVWGLNYYYTKDLYSTIVSHFLWDLLIFVFFPIH
ncbi:MAG: CPBP family glutamic-type intramembrane protease [Thaumarchaeota archaeon]|nr:CPBP family glutamic-type intramembrane protease [Nitrososphaerota archaeon]